MLAITALDLDRFALALRGVVLRPVRWIGAIRRDQVNRRTYRHMLHMSDHQLKDIGLTRDDLYWAMSEPPTWDDV